MNTETHIPTASLRPFISKYLIIECQDELVNRIFPDTSLVMAFRFKGKTSYVTDHERNTLPTITLSGLRKSGRLVNYAGNSGNILVIFKEAGASALIKEPLHELFDESIPLRDLSGYHDLSMIEDQLSAATGNGQRIQIIEQFLLSKLYDHKTDNLIAAALEKIRQAKGIIRIKDLADTLCISQDAFEKRFRRVAGVSPKQFSFIVRMKAIIGNGIREHTLAETAFNAGYFDQPHFNKDFKLFTGQTPTEFLRSPARW
jgi:AraC-like DNA-binding protein